MPGTGADSLASPSVGIWRTRGGARGARKTAGGVLDAASARPGEPDAALQRGREEIPHLLEPPRHRAQVESARVEAGPHLAPAQRRRDGRAVDATRRVRGDDGLALRVLQAVEIQPSAAPRAAALERDLG